MWERGPERRWRGRSVIPLLGGAFASLSVMSSCGLAELDRAESSESEERPAMSFLTSAVEGHTHRLFVPYEDVYTPKVGGLMLSTTHDDRHAHEVYVRQADLLTIVSRGVVVRPTSHTLGHQHEVVLSLVPLTVDGGPATDAGVAGTDAGVGALLDATPSRPDAEAAPRDAGTDVRQDVLPWQPEPAE